MITLGTRAVEIISTEDELSELLRGLQESKPARIALNMEGELVSREGTITLLALSWDNDEVIHVLDMQVLGAAAFSATPEDTTNPSLKTVLEDEDVVKVFCDPRPDSDALYHHYGVHVKNGYCVQLAEIAVRRQIRPTFEYVNGGKKITDAYGGVEESERSEREDLDRRGKQLLFPDKGGSFENLRKRPLDPIAVQYAALSVSHLLHVQGALEARLQERGKEWVREESKKRVNECLLPAFGGRGKHRARAPPHWT